jgi:hypothetical protein
VAIVWADTDALVGDGSLVRVWGSPPSTPIGDFGSQVSIPEAIVHMIAPAPQILGLVLGRAYVGVGSQTSSGTVRTTAWNGDVSLLDATYPHYPTTTGLVAVHDYGTEPTVAPESWHVLDAPESDVPIVPGQALAISIHGLGGGTMIRFDQTGAGPAAYSNTLRHPSRAFDWYPMSGDGPEDSGGSEVEAHHPDSPFVFGDGNPSIVVDPSQSATTPHAQDPDDRRPGNVPAVALELLVRGASVS